MMVVRGDRMQPDFLITSIKRVIFVGKNEYQEMDTVFRQPLKSHELIFNFSGQSTVYFNGKVLHVEENTIRFLPKGENREYIVSRKIRGDCIDVFFDTDRPVAAEAFVTGCQQSEAVGHLFKKIFSLWVAKGEGYYFECMSLLYKIFAQISRENYIPDGQYRAIKPAIDHIETYFRDEKLSVEGLAQLCGISDSYLKKLFIRKFGMPPSKYVISLRIHYACDLLQTGFYSVARVAELCGYRDIYFFSRQFKKYMGVSPSEFAKKYRSSK